MESVDTNESVSSPLLVVTSRTCDEKAGTGGSAQVEPVVEKSMERSHAARGPILPMSTSKFSVCMRMAPITARNSGQCKAFVHMLRTAERFLMIYPAQKYAWLCCMALSSLVLGSGDAKAHGGLPISVQIVHRGDKTFIPTQYWGVFVGQQGQPWRWICDEAINSNKLRNVYIGGDGTFYATDKLGLTISRDDGCSWEQVTGELAQQTISSVALDPVASSTVWAVASDEMAQAMLWRSDDAGKTWQALYRPTGMGILGLALSPDGKAVYLGAARRLPMIAGLVLESTDGGHSFQEHLISPLPRDANPFSLSVMAADPRVSGQVWLRFKDPEGILVQADLRAKSFTELLRISSDITAVAVDVAHDRLLVATGQGIYSASGAAPLERGPSLSRAQCVSLYGDTVEACSWNYAPDSAAMSRSVDDGKTFTRVFQYHETAGVYSCPPSTPVAQICPQVWQTYAEQLGIEQSKPTPPMPPDPQVGGCGVALPHRSGPLGGVVAAFAGVLAVLFRRRRRIRQHIAARSARG